MRLAFAVLAAAVAAAVPRATGPIAVTAQSYPFMTARRAQELVDLEKLGDIEEEFFISGMANVYDWDADGGLSVRIANAPYTTRILVRRPVTPARFSGTVVVEPLNNARAYDWAFVWAYSDRLVRDRWLTERDGRRIKAERLGPLGVLASRF